MGLVISSMFTRLIKGSLVRIPMHDGEGGESAVPGRKPSFGNREFPRRSAKLVGCQLLHTDMARGIVSLSRG
jgi:hypothetical protein